MHLEKNCVIKIGLTLDEIIAYAFRPASTNLDVAGVVADGQMDAPGSAWSNFSPATRAPHPARDRRSCPWNERHPSACTIHG